MNGPRQLNVVDDLSGQTRSGTPISLNQWASSYDHFQYLTHQYPLFGYGPSYPNEKIEEMASNFRGYTGGAFMGNGIVFACILSRLQVFSQARFQFRQLRSGRPGDYFGSEALLPLEQPEPGMTTADLLAHMETDVSLAGNSFIVRRGNRLKRLRPDWMAIVLDASEEEIDAEVLGYAYWPGGIHSGNDPVALPRDEVAHYAPIKDPLARYRGMSWITPVIREVMADKGFVDHKIKFLEHGGTHNFLFQIAKESMSEEQFNAFISSYRTQHESPDGAYRSIFLRAAIDATPLGSNMQQTDFKKVTGAGETRIAAAAGVPPIVAGFSEGLEAATYSNYGQARRRFADGTVRHLWQNAAASLQNIIDTPTGSQLWYDDRDIPALQEDLKERAEVQTQEATSIRTLIDGGFDPQSVIDAVSAGDWKRLSHGGLLSVQLQEPGAPPSTNGASAPPVVAEQGTDG
jgi:phage portal protein BeeE